MFLGQIHSPANPFQGSALSTYGLKPASGIAAFSVGDKAADPDSYITKAPDGSNPTASISGGILTFSCPQTNSYIGIGDQVIWSGGVAYITGKRTTREWDVRDADGKPPGDITDEEITSIDKVFETLAEAIDSASSGALDLMSSADLVDLDICLHIACYTKASNSSDGITITGWTTSQANFIKIFAPNNIEKECNHTQRHDHKFGGFFINSNAITTLITIADDNVMIDGVCFKEVGACNVGIDIQGSGEVDNCLFEGFALHGILVTESVDNIILQNNILYNGAGSGIGANASTKIINCTVYGYVTGYEFTAPGADTYAANCVGANNTTDFDDASAIEHCASDDATAVGTGCVAGAALTFYDTIALDFRLTNSNDEDVIRSGLDLRTVSPYYVTRDAVGSLNDDTPSMGALHLVPSLPIAIGDTSNLMTGSPNISISDGIITFDVAQTNDLLSAGCVLEPGTITLLEKIDTSNWRATLDTGLAPADDAGPTAVISIKFKFDSVFALTPPAVDLVSADTKLKVLCVEKTGASDTAAEIIGITSDETRDVSVYSPTAGLECNSNRRHAGVWDDSLMSITRISSEDIGYLSIIGLQIGPYDGEGIYSKNDMTLIDRCIVKETGVKAIPSATSPATIAIINNTIYDYDGAGIQIESGDKANIFAIYNNTIFNCGYGIMFSNGHDDKVRLVNNLLILNGQDFVLDSPRSSLMSSESNWTSDVSAFALSYGFNNDIFKTVQFIAHRNFHIPLAQHVLMNTAYAASADHFYQVYSDIDSVDRPLDSQWSIGSDQYSIPSKKIAVFSVGLSTADLQDQAGLGISISGSIATFADALDNDIGIGDKVTMISGTVYLAEKGSSSIWRVVDNEGAAVADTTDALVSIKRVSNSLASAMSADVATELNIGGQDLVSNEIELMVECYQDTLVADTGAVAITGWTTDSDYCITVESPFDTFTQCGRRQRHTGVWSTSRYHLEVAGDAITVTNDYVYIDGLQIDPTNNYGIILANSSIESKAERCIVKNASTGIYQETAGYDVRINANIIYNSSAYAIDIKKGTCNNNTAVSDSGTALYLTLIGATLTNNIGQGSVTNYSGAGALISCISSDLTGTTASVTLDFAGATDYHLARDDFEAINYGADDTNNPLYDIDSQEILEYSIGADCEIYDTINQTFSCGNLTSSFTNPGLYVTVSSGVAKFSTDLEDLHIMIGDKLTYDVDNKEAYLYRKIAADSWIVVDELGENPIAASSVQVVSIKRTFNDLSAVFGTSGSIATSLYGDATNPFISLSKGKMKINIALGGESAQTSAVAISGFETDEDNYFRLYAPYDTINECNERHKHTDFYDPAGTGYCSAIIPNPSVLSDSIAISCPYTEIDGIVVKGKYASVAGLAGISTASTNCKIINNIIYSAKYGVHCNFAGNLLTIVANNIIYHCHVAGIKTSTKDYILSNTVVDVVTTGIDNSMLSVILNDIVQDSGLDFALGPLADYCISKDGSASGDGSITATLTFHDKPNNDYNLDKNDPRGVGTQLSGYPAYSFSVDATETIRGRYWDIGALEYEAEKTVYYSVGNEPDHKTINPSNPILKINVGADGIGSFSWPQTSDHLVSGDKVVCTAGTMYLAEKIDTSTWRVTTYNGNKPTAKEYTVNSIERAWGSFHTTSYTVCSYIGGSDLVSAGVQVNIVIPNDNNIGAYGNIVSYTCDADYFFRIFVPRDVLRHCNVSQGHKGKYNDGATLNITGSQKAIRVYNTRFFELSGLILSNSYANGIGVELDGASEFLIEANIIRNCKGGGILCYSDIGTAIYRIGAIVNNIIYNCESEGLLISGTYANVIWAMNNTIVKCGHGIYHKKPAANGVIVKAYNNICQSSIFSDFAEDNSGNTGKFLLYYNISEDDTAGILEHNLNNSFIGFIDRAAENFFLDADTDSAAIDSAFDLRMDSPYFFNNDIRNVARSELLWDRGAIERNENVGSGSMQIGPLYMNNSGGLVTDSFPTTILYLRHDLHPNIDPNVQFASIALLNVYLAWNDIDNIIIYVGGGEYFDDEMFALNDRGARTVKIQTDPSEIESDGPASIGYDTALIDHTSVNGSVTFENIRIYSVNAQTGPYLIEDTAALTKMIFINCIVQVNEDAIIDGAACVVEIINSIVLYFNESTVATTYYLTKNGLTGQRNYNSIFLVESADDMTFQMTDGAMDDYVINCITKNIGSGDFDINAPGRKTECLENEDPLFTEIETGWATTDVSVIMTSNFKPTLESPTVDNGEPEVLSLYDIPTDIIGNDRVFQFGEIDIGPYELEVHIMDISGSDIQRIDQIKVDIDRVNRRLISLSDDVVYVDIYDAFQYNQDAMEEFIREENIAIELKNVEKTKDLKTDKVNQLIAEFEAYYDSSTKTILVKKVCGESPSLLGRILEDDSYVLHFNEQEHKLYLFLNEVALLGLSGLRNPIKNIRFGGNPTYNG